MGNTGFLFVALVAPVVLQPFVTSLVLLFRHPPRGEGGASRRIVRQASGAALLITYLPCYYSLWRVSNRSNNGASENNFYETAFNVLLVPAANLAALLVWSVLYRIWRKWNQSSTVTTARFRAVATFVAIVIPISVWAILWKIESL